MKQQDSLETRLGRLVIVADERGVHQVTFQGGVELTFPLGKSAILQQAQSELREYLEGTRKEFSFPYVLQGTLFQQEVWKMLTQIPYGQTISYQTLAQRVGRPRAWRAVAMANRANPLALVIPCHRVVYASGQLGGYASGVERKQWLLAHEARENE